MGTATTKVTLRHVSPVLISSAMEREALDMREALLAIEYGYDDANVLSMSKRSQEIYAKLKETL